MSNPFRGSDVAADNISLEDVEAFEAFMEVRMEKLRAGDEGLLKKRFGYLSLRPRALPEGDSLLATGAGSPYSFCQLCSKIFSCDIQISNSWIPAIMDRYPHHSSLENLYSAASSGCPLCRLLWMNIANNFFFTSG